MSDRRDRPLTILQLSGSDLRGGAEQVAFSLHRIYREMGHRSILAVGEKRSDDPDVVAIARAGRFRGLGLLKVVAEKLLGWQDLSRPGSRELQALVGRPWDVLHAHNLHGGYFDLAALPALSRLAPTFLTMHDNWLQTGGCACHFECRRWRTGCGRCPAFSPLRILSRFGTRLNWRRKRRLLAASRVWLTAPSRWLLEEAGESLLAGKPSRVVPNGVDLDVFHPGPKAAARSELGLPEGTPLVLFAASGGLANFAKDGRTLLAAHGRLVREMPGAMLLVLGGSGIPDGAEAPPAGSILVRPFEADPCRMALYHRAADVLAHATLADNAPLVIIEALASGLPVVASKVGGISELVEDGRTGLLVPPRDPAALAAALARVLGDRSLPSALSQAAMARAREHHDLRAQARSYLEWYRELISEAAGPGRP